MSFARDSLAEAVGSALRSDAPPPLRVWAATAVALVAFLIASVISFAGRYEPFVAFNMARLKAFAGEERGPDVLSVIALGDSRLRYAMLNDEALAQLARRRGVPNLHVLRIVDNLASYATFVAFEDAILASRPDLLLIQFDLLFRERKNFAFYKQHLPRWMRYLVRRASVVEVQEWLQHDTGGCRRPDEPERETPEQLWARMTTFDQGVRVNVSSHYFDHVLRFVERARGAGIAVALLQIRSSPELEAFYDGSDLDPDEALARLRRETDLPLWAVPTRLARSEHFCDYVHLNEHARRLVSEWLITRIAAAATSL